MREYMSAPGVIERIHWASLDRFGHTADFDAATDSWVYGRWPLPNVWLGVSVEDQQRYDQRIGHLLRTPAVVRFLSVEPLLGRIDMRMGGMSVPDHCAHDALPEVDWVIVGGESGPGARPLEVSWVRGVVNQCRAARVPVFVKQLGSAPRDAAAQRDDMGARDVWPAGWMPIVDGVRVWRPDIADRKGGDMAEWPADLRVREFPR